MLEGIRAIGEAALERRPLVDALIDTQILEKQGKDRGLVVTLDLHLDPPRLEVDCRDLDEQALRDVLWVGNAAGSNSPQDRLTTDNPTYLASQTVPNLLDALPAGELKELLRRIREAVYLDLGEKAEVFPEGGGDQQYKRYRRVWDLQKLKLDGDLLGLLSKKEREGAEALCAREGVEFMSRGFLQAYARKKGKAGEAVKLVGKVLQAWVARKLDVKSSRLKLYTLAVEGDLLVHHPEYRAYVERKLVEEVFEGPEAGEGHCHACGRKGRVTANTTRFELLVFYNTDKPGFASGLRDRKKGGFLRNYTLCKGCYRALLAGERFVANELRTRLGRSDVYVIPTFHAPEAYPTVETLEGWAEYLKARLSASETIEKWHEFQRNLERYQPQEAQKGLFVLDLLFAQKARAAVKVDKLIPEVPPSRLDRLDEVRNRVYDRACEHLGEGLEWDLGLKNLFYLLPLRQRDGRAEVKPYLELLDALLVGRRLSVRALIPLLLETACVHRFERYEAYVQGRPQDPERALVLHLLRSQLFLRYLKELGQLRGLEGGGERPMAEDVVEVERSMVDEGVRAWMDGLGLSGPRRGLFLLGVLIGRIGSTPEQRESGKPILNKVHFQGMDRGKIVRLANEVYEKLRQYKIAQYNEGLYAAMKAHLDRSIGELGSPQENVYWVLSGYAYATQQAIRRKASGAEKQDEKEVTPGE